MKFLKQAELEMHYDWERAESELLASEVDVESLPFEWSHYENFAKLCFAKGYVAGHIRRAEWDSKDYEAAVDRMCNSNTRIENMYQGILIAFGAIIITLAMLLVVVLSSASV